MACGSAPQGQDCAPPRIYWGDVHGHTELSDGKGDLDHYFRQARDVARLDFAIVTDHDFGHAHPWRLSEQDWERIQARVEAWTEPGRFIAIAGYEWTSQPKYWTEGLLAGEARYFNHKNVYFPARVPDVFRAKDPRYSTPEALACAVLAAGGLVHNNHPSTSAECREQWDYPASAGEVIANTEIGPDTLRYEGRVYSPGTESAVNAFLRRGGRTGFVAGSDTHDGQPAAHTAVLAPALTRPAIFAALRGRRCYAVRGARIRLELTIDGGTMGAEIAVHHAPRVHAAAFGSAPIRELALVRDGSVVATAHSAASAATLAWCDRELEVRAPGSTSYYYVRVTQDDTDAHGNPSMAWSSPIWVTRR